MVREHTRSSGAGLERSRESGSGEWIRSSRPLAWLEVLRAQFAGRAFSPHRHDTYAIGLTEHGVQAFDYRGATRRSVAGQVLVLHPDEVHDGRAGDGRGFGYAIVYVDPESVAEAVRSLCGGPCALPFVRDAVGAHPQLARALHEAFAAPIEPLAADALLLALAEGLLRAGNGDRAPRGPGRVDRQAVRRARDFLDAHCTRVVHSAELEAVSGLGRHALTRQFRVALGTTPHRYVMGRRLARARESIDRGTGLADVAQGCGFADQAHLTRALRDAFGLTPARYRALARGGRSPGETRRPVPGVRASDDGRSGAGVAGKATPGEPGIRADTGEDRKRGARSRGA